MTGSHSFCFIVSERYKNAPKPANTFDREAIRPFANKELREYHFYTPRPKLLAAMSNKLVSNRYLFTLKRNPLLDLCFISDPLCVSRASCT